MEYAPLDYQDENPLTILGGLPSTNSFDNITTNDLLNNIEPVTSVQNTFNESIIIRDTLQNVLQGVEVLPIDDKDSYSKSSFISKDKEMERIDYSQHMMKLR